MCLNLIFILKSGGKPRHSTISVIFHPDRYALTTDSQDVRKSFLAAWKKLNREAPHFGATSHGDSERWWSDLVHGTMKGCQKIIDFL